MASKTRSSEGCWTCRLRRKKCDERRPQCDGCAALEIDCLYSDEKPTWMDGADRQREKAEWLKREVKRRATHRRERRYLQSLEAGFESLGVSMTLSSPTQTPAEGLKDSQNPPNSSHDISSTAGPSFLSPASSPESSARPHDSGSESGGNTIATDPSSFGTPLTSADDATPTDAVPETPLAEGMPLEEEQLNNTMTYLDYVFPFLFPFYRPSLLDAGRGWLLVLLTKNKVLFHTAMSLASYLFNVVITHSSSELHTECRRHNFEALQRDQQLALKSLRAEMQQIVRRGVRGHLVETNRVMGCIVQLLTFEVAVANTGSWMMHLDAAIELFTEILKQHAQPPQHIACFGHILALLARNIPSWTLPGRPWSTDQASLRFFTANLLFLDTLASTTLGRAPRLHPYHAHLLTPRVDGVEALWPTEEKEPEPPHIDLKEFVGIENWVVRAIADVAALDAWKKEMKKAGSLSMTQLVTQAAAIEATIRQRLSELAPAGSDSFGVCKSARPDLAPTPWPPAPETPAKCGGALADAWDTQLLSFTPQTDIFSPQLVRSCGSRAMAAIWAHAALTYLSVVVSGWQPGCPEVRHSVNITTSLLLSLPSPTILRTMVWPFTVTGCMAAPEQEQSFRDMVTAMGPLRAFGTISQALSILEHVWANRATIESSESWDYATCFNALGAAPLLV